MLVLLQLLKAAIFVVFIALLALPVGAYFHFQLPVSPDISGMRGLRMAEAGVAPHAVANSMSGIEMAEALGANSVSVSIAPRPEGGFALKASCDVASEDLGIALSLLSELGMHAELRMDDGVPPIEFVRWLGPELTRTRMHERVWIAGDDAIDLYTVRRHDPRLITALVWREKDRASDPVRRYFHETIVPGFIRIGLVRIEGSIDHEQRAVWRERGLQIVPAAADGAAARQASQRAGQSFSSACIGRYCDQEARIGLIGEDC